MSYWEKYRRECEAVLSGDQAEARRAKMQLVAASARATRDGNTSEANALRRMFERMRV